MNPNFGTVIIGCDELQAQTLELERQREATFYGVAAARVAAADSDPGHKSISLRDAVGQAAFETITGADTETVPDSELFE